METAAAAATSILGIVLIRGVWRRETAYRTAVVSGGWALLALSVVLWARVAGAEYGTVIALGLLGCVAWIASALNVSVKAGRAAADPVRESPAWPGVATLGGQFATFGLAVPLAGVASLLATMGVSRLLPAAEIDRMAFVIVMLPIVWGMLAFVVCFLDRALYALGLVLLSAAAGFALMWL